MGKWESACEVVETLHLNRKQLNLSLMSLMNLTSESQAGTTLGIAICEHILNAKPRQQEGRNGTVPRNLARKRKKNRSKGLTKKDRNKDMHKKNNTVIINQNNSR